MSETSFTLMEAWSAIQRLGLLGEFDGGTWLRHVVRVFGHEAAARPLTEDQLHELLFRARVEDPELEHTQGRAARLDGMLLGRDLNEDDEARILASVRALAAHYGVSEVTVDDVFSPRSIFLGLGRAFAKAGVAHRVFLVGKHEQLILIRQELEPIGPFAPAKRYEASDDPRAAAAPPDGAQGAASACPICAWPAALQDAFCPACRVGLTIAGDGTRGARVPELRRGATLMDWDLRRVPPPGCSSRATQWPGTKNALSAHAEGVMYEGYEAQVTTLVEPQLRVRRGCVRFGFTALTSCRVGVVVRDEPIEAASIRYVLDLALPGGTLFVARLVTGPKLSSQTVLTSRGVQAPYLRPPDEPNELELRMDGGWLLAYLNGALSLRVYDPAYGIGRVGFRVGREPNAPEPVTRVLLRSAAVHWLEGGP